METGLAGKVAIVAGASEGMGLAAAKKLAEEGVKVAICSRSESRIAAAAKKIGKADVYHAAVDVTEPSGGQALRG